MKTAAILTLVFLISNSTAFSQNSQILFRQGHEKLEMANYEEAFKLFNQAALADDKFLDAVVMRGYCRFKIALYDGQSNPAFDLIVGKALEDFNKVINLDPKIAWHIYIEA